MAVEQTRSQNRTVRSRRSAEASDLAANREEHGGRGQSGRRVRGDGREVAIDAAPSAAIASRSFLRWPTIVTPRSFKSSDVTLGRSSPSIALYAKHGSVLSETEVLEPSRDVHGRPQSARWDNRLRLVVCKASANTGATHGALMSICAQPSPPGGIRFLEASRPFMCPSGRAPKGAIRRVRRNPFPMTGNCAFETFEATPRMDVLC